MLVMSNAYLNPHIRPLIPEREFIYSLNRTIHLLYKLSPMSPVFRKNRDVLKYAKADVMKVYNGVDPGMQLPPSYECGLEQNHNRRAEYGQVQSPGRPPHGYTHLPPPQPPP